MYKSKKINEELRAKRAESEVSLSDFPLKIRRKPTAHKQYCYECRELMEKGQPQILMRSGVWSLSENSAFANKRYFRSVYIDKGTRLSGKLFPRNIYLHNHCFSCLVKRMFSKAGLALNIDCESCDKRFNCYTGNLDGRNYGTYIPSRPCGVDEHTQS